MADASRILRWTGRRTAPTTLPASLWTDQLAGPVTPRAAVRGEERADVCVVGAGFTGLWTAYHLAALAPGRRIVVVERALAGFGASGRNGGWCSALFPVAALADEMRAPLVATVDEVGAVADAEGIDCDYAKDGYLRVATTPAQAARLRAEAGDGWLDANAVAARIRVSGALGGVFDPDCAALSPGKLARGLAEAVERRGVTVFEQSPARRIGPGLVELDGGAVRADVVIRATEAWTSRLPGGGREIAPLYSLVIATEPLPAAAWDEIGWRERFTLNDDRRLIIYAQRSADGRIVLGGRGAPYHLGSRIKPAFDHEDAVFEHLRHTLGTLFPAAARARITHRWGGPLGVPRDWTPAVRFDPSRGLGSAGGYVGDGVAAAALAGKTLAELVAGLDTPNTRLPWVNRPVRQWEPEPLRWIGINAGRLGAAASDARENRTGRPSRLGKAVDRLTGH
ncbi:NAD(P)/FAD-dependent oxidoreductase [Frankia nepalensis]|uniref:FAD-dependent oxidoreductase n=1 Tax=Frankia nepalensis TaxID=1836974 RepID=A0A937UTJ9_9ACTN|nr:FAD-dependent oxidoreductase [Frankia nepalensis]MBL7500750.1 FAD-dependent oxidoreductase [Frankia nepalensis]MBL7511762.1 FAD-dependent oxidoreductase [Frankia nepalensis]MBL7633178.1 FAD-dependent oxidoreductase [Frankia nepalensis]